MNVLFLVLILTIGLKSSLSAALCNGITDAAYRNEVVKIVSRNLPEEDQIYSSSFVCVMVKKAVRYRNAGGGDGSTEDIAARCFLKDLYKDIKGIDATAHASTHIKSEIIENCFPGEGFEP